MSAMMKQTCVENDVPTPHTPRISKFTVQSSAHGVSYLNDDLSTNPTKGSSHHSTISLTSTHCSVHSKCEETSEQQPWLDLSFLGRVASQGDYFCNYWRHTVAHEQDLSFSHFMETVDARGCDTWQGCSNGYTPSCVKLPASGVRMDWECYDDWAWQPGGWHRGETGAQWQLGHVVSKVPNEVRIGSGGYKSDSPDTYIHAEGHAEFGVIGDASHERRRNLLREQDPKPRQPLMAETRKRSFNETRPIVSHITSTSFIADILLKNPNPSNEASVSVPHSSPRPQPSESTPRFPMGSNHDLYACTSSSTQIPRTSPNRPVNNAAHTGPLILRYHSESSVSTYNPRKPSSVKWSRAPPGQVIDRTRKYSHNPSQITTPAPLQVPTEPSPSPASRDHLLREADAAVAHTSRYRRLLGFFYVRRATLGCGVVH